MKKTFTEQDFAAFVGIDWADEVNLVSVRQAGSEKSELVRLLNKPELIHEWISDLHSRCPGKIAIGVEHFRGALLYQLQQYDFIVLFPINPKTMSKYREALRSSGAKDDPSDAILLMNFLQKHLWRLRPLIPQDPLTFRLQRLVENRRKFVDRCSSLTRQIKQELKFYFPQSLKWIGELNTKMACDFLTKWPTLAAVKKAKPDTVRNFFRKHNCRKSNLIERRLEEIRVAIGPIEDPLMVSASSLIVNNLILELKTAINCVNNFDKAIEGVFKDYPDRFVYESLPGAGPALEPRLAVAMGIERSRYQSAAELQQFSGVAPVTDKSGKACRVHWRWACPKFMRQTFIEFTACSLPRCAWAKACYEEQRARGKSHNAALRAVAFKWQRIIFACWKNRQPYDESKYLKRLKPKTTLHRRIRNCSQTNNRNFESVGEIIERFKSNTPLEIVEKHVEKGHPNHQKIT